MSVAVVLFDFSYTSGATLTAKLFASGSIDAGEVYTAAAVTEYEDGASHLTGRYYATVASVDEGDYQMIVYASSVGVVSNLHYTVSATSSVEIPWSEWKPLTSSDVSAAAGLGSGASARTITVTVDDGSATVLSGARVAVLTDAEVATGQAPVTGVLGTASLVLNDGDYLLRVVPPNGYSAPADVALTVTSSETPVTISLDAVVIAGPDDPTLATLVVKCIDENGASEAGVVVYARLFSIPSGGTGYAYDSTVQSAISGSDGNATLTVVRLATYQVKRGTGLSWTQVTIADEDVTTITSLVGSP